MISTRGRYAIRVLIDMAEHEDSHSIPLKDIAERQGISKKYLEIIVKDMVTAGLITGTSGRGGGYRLCRKPEDYNIGEVLHLLEGTLAPVACLAVPNFDCPRRGECKTLPMWAEFDQMVHDFFYGKKLSDLVTKKKE
ncbi:MAG: Rrf2 family transcriptional regulator [Lachnospiraceae bacterium]|nr:Rrf2 family transcriptional regulator [Lachnospiraceae bacterium]